MRLNILHIVLIFTLSIITLSADLANKEISNRDTVIYNLDTEQSILEWYCDIHHGNVFFDSGYIEMLNGEIIAGRFVICMESLIDLDIDNYELMKVTLENTLKSIEFFHTTQFHHAIFEFDFIEKTDNAYEISGDLELMNVAQCINFAANIEFDGNKIIATSDSIVIDRTHWGITSMSKDDAKSDKSFIVPNDIGIIAHIVAYHE